MRSVVDRKSFQGGIVGVIPEEKPIDLEAIRARNVMMSFGNDGHGEESAESEAKRDIDALLAEVERLRALESAVVRLETLHGGVGHPQNCSALGVCAIGEVMHLVRQPLLIVDAEHDVHQAAF